MPSELLRIEVEPKEGRRRVWTDAEYVVLINSDTYGIPGGEAILDKLRAGNKVVFLNSENIDYMTIVEADNA